MKRVYLTCYAHQNLGDDLFVKLLCERYPQTRFYLSCSRFFDDAFENIKNLVIMNRHHLWGMLVQNSKRLLNRLGWKNTFPFDAQVYIGGSIFIEPQDWHPDHPYQRELYAQHLQDTLPYFILGANFGPHHQEDFVSLHQTFFSQMCQDVCFRDQTSANLFKQTAVVRYAPDIVLTYHMPVMDKKPWIVISCIEDDHRVGLTDFDNQAYCLKMAEIISHYQAIGKKVFLVSMCQEQGDERACQAIQALCKDVSLVYYRGEMAEIVNLFAQAEYVIASRFHAMILGWLGRASVFPISYNNKTEQVIQDYGFAGAYCWIDQFASLTFEQIDANRAQGYVFDVTALCQAAQKQFEKLDAFLGEPHD